MLTNNRKISQSSKTTIFRVLRQIAYTKLFKKYSSGIYSYHKILANNLVYNDNCRIVARFKDYLILDDNSEFIRRFYFNEESHPRLVKILNFYETYSKIFPNYMILKESKYLYRNIRKKQKMIDAVNEIKREEEENRKKMKQNNIKEDNDTNELFTKNVKEEIKTFQENTTFQRYNNDFDSDNDDNNENSISISLMNRKMFENMENKFDVVENDRFNSIKGSFVTNETNHSISGILNVLNDNKIYIKDLPKLFDKNNYSKTSQKIKKINKMQKKIKSDIQLSVNINNENNLFQSKNKQGKKNKNFFGEYDLHKKTVSSSSNLINSIHNNYISGKNESKKLTMISTSPGAILTSNTDKHVNNINQYQNIIIPKGNTVININNNYFDQTPSSTLQMGYYTNKNYNINKNLKQKYNYEMKKSNTNNIYKKSNNIEKDNNNLQKVVKNVNEKDKINSQNINCIYKTNHNKRISQDYIYRKIHNNDAQNIKEKLIKFNSLSPTPIISRFDGKFQNNKIIEKIDTNINNEQEIYHNYLTQNNNTDLLTANLNGKDDIDYKDREKLVLNIRDVIDNKRKENDYQKSLNIHENILFSDKKNKIKSKIQPYENKFNNTIFSKNKTTTNFKSQDKNNSNMLKNTDKGVFEEKYLSKKNIIHGKISNEKSKNITINKKEKNEKYKKLQIKEKKNKSKGYIKSNKLSDNYYTNSNTRKYSDKNKIFSKTKNNFKNNKKLFDNINKENQILKSIEKQPKKHTKILSLNDQALKCEAEDKDYLIDKKTMTISQNMFSGTTPNTYLFMSNKKENQSTSASTKIYHKSRVKVKSMNYKKDNLNLDNNNLNSICYSNINNYANEYNNGNDKRIMTDNSSMIKNMNSYEIKEYNNSELKIRYKKFLLKKNKLKSCELENQSEINQKINKDLVDRIILLKQNNKHCFYHNYTENMQSTIKSYRIDNISSFDNNSLNLNKVANINGLYMNYISENNGFQTPSMENKKIGLYKKVTNKTLKMIKTEKKLDNKKNQNCILPAAIKVNRSKFMENVKNKMYDENSKTKKN